MPSLTTHFSRKHGGHLLVVKVSGVLCRRKSAELRSSVVEEMRTRGRARVVICDYRSALVTLSAADWDAIADDVGDAIHAPLSVLVVSHAVMKDAHAFSRRMAARHGLVRPIATSLATAEAWASAMLAVPEAIPEPRVPLSPLVPLSA